MPIDTKYDDLKSLRIDRSTKQTSGPRWARRVIVIGIAILVLAGVVALAVRLFSSPVTEVQVVRPKPVTSAGGDVVLQAAGYIVAHHKIDVNSKVTGRVAWIGVEKADKVKAGQVLVRLEQDEFQAQVDQDRGAVANAEAYLQELQNGSRPEEIQQASANLEEARANLDAAQKTLARTKPMAEQGVVSRQDLDDAQAKYDAARQHMDALEKAYALAKLGPRPEEIERAKGALLQARGALAYAQSQLDATLIRAPVDGTILDRTAEKGELVTAMFASAADTGGPRGSVVSLADLSDLQVELDISQNDFARLGPKQQATLTTDAYPDREYKGVIDEISPEANRQKATVQVKVKVLNPDDYLRPEENANVRFLANESEQKVVSGSVLPAAALRDEAGRKIVFVAFDGRAARREVKVLSQHSDGVLVDGLTGGEDVIVNAPPTLQDGSKVKIKP